MVALHLGDRPFARQLALAVNPERIRSVAFVVRSKLCAVEYIISGVVNQRDAELQRFFR
ncbi:hypothetical protein D3C73_1634450 [compost metagenome]